MSTDVSLETASLPSDLLKLAHQLLLAAQAAPRSELVRLLDLGAPAWYQDDELGWSCLFYAAERREPALLALLLQAGAVWNAVDKWGRTAGEVCLSLGDWEGWEIIRNEGVRSVERSVDGLEMLHHAMGGAGDALNLRAEDKTSAGDNLAFLSSKLTWDTGDDGRERVLDADGNGVMMGWEEPLSGLDGGPNLEEFFVGAITLLLEHVRLMTSDHPKLSEGLSVLNVGFGLGIVDRLFQTTSPAHHTIIEAHPQVLAYIRAKGFDKLPGVRVLEGRWQDWVCAERIADVLAATPGGMGFDAVFVDTFAEGYEDLKAFFEFLPDILEAEHGVFSFWNGLGATNPTIYAVSSHLAELHLDDVGLAVAWHDVAIPESLREEVWRGVRRRYWDLPGYRLPLARMRLM